jgi:hypothetical protein
VLREVLPERDYLVGVSRQGARELLLEARGVG